MSLAKEAFTQGSRGVLLASAITALLGFGLCLFSYKLDAVLPAPAFTGSAYLLGLVLVQASAAAALLALSLPLRASYPGRPAWIANPEVPSALLLLFVGTFMAFHMDSYLIQGARYWALSDDEMV